MNPVPRLHSRGIGALPFGDKAHSSPPAQAGLPVVRGESSPGQAGRLSHSLLKASSSKE